MLRALRLRMLPGGDRTILGEPDTMSTANLDHVPGIDETHDAPHDSIPDRLLSHYQARVSNLLVQREPAIAGSRLASALFLRSSCRFLIAPLLLLQPDRVLGGLGA